MTETLLAKLAGSLWEVLKYVWVAFVGLLVWIFRRQDAEIRHLKKEVSEMNVKISQTVDHEFFEEKRKEIEKKVEGDHQRIVDTMREIQSILRTDLHNCNSSLREDLKNSSTFLTSEVRQIRDFLMNHLERRDKPRD